LSAKKQKQNPIRLLKKTQAVDKLKSGHPAVSGFIPLSVAESTPTSPNAVQIRKSLGQADCEQSDAILDGVCDLQKYVC
jgi:hypothetical protein